LIPWAGILCVHMHFVKCAEIAATGGEQLERQRELRPGADNNRVPAKSLAMPQDCGSNNCCLFGARRKFVSEHRIAALGLRTRGFVLNDIPVLRENPVLHADNIHNHPIGDSFAQS
jgi:hypothetical protein